MKAMAGVGMAPQLATVVSAADGITRCRWATETGRDLIAYHDEEWGTPTQDEAALFEALALLRGQDLQNPVAPGGAHIVDLHFQIVVILREIVENSFQPARLIGAEVQIASEAIVGDLASIASPIRGAALQFPM